MGENLKNGKKQLHTLEYSSQQLQFGVRRRFPTDPRTCQPGGNCSTGAELGPEFQVQVNRTILLPRQHKIHLVK